MELFKIISQLGSRLETTSAVSGGSDMIYRVFPWGIPPYRLQEIFHYLESPRSLYACSILSPRTTLRKKFAKISFLESVDRIFRLRNTVLSVTTRKLTKSLPRSVALLSHL